MKLKPRLDELLVQRGFFADVHDAQVAVLAGEVVVGEHRETSAGKRLDPNVSIRLKGQSAFVSRGGEKLAGALKAFELDVGGLACADLGASSGGFTDCLLKAGAARVSSIDVNYGQFDWSLRNDPRVALYERTNVRGLDPQCVGGPFQLVVGDLSFVSIASLMPSIAKLMAPSGQLVILIKPQFEIEKSLVGEGGIVRDPLLHEQAICQVLSAAQACGLRALGLAVSPIKGTKGNREFLLWAQKDASGMGQGSTIGRADAQRIVQQAHDS